MKKNVKIKLDELEVRIVVEALNDFRNKLIAEGKDVLPVDKVIVKILK
ncbi:MAG TPA: hypothetical protein OIM45_02850 [Clostridiaceae bacterium]|nr:hypothetical protein [Clostridiaceae bacterium]